MAEMSRMLGFWLDATETARFFASTAHNCDNVTFPCPRPDAMDGAVRIQRRRHRATGWGIRDYGSCGTFCDLRKAAHDYAGTPDDLLIRNIDLNRSEPRN